MTTLPQMGLILPVRGAPGAGVWDDTIDADLTAIDAHDHSSGKGTRVPTAGININADLTFSSLWAPINLHRITFASIVALTGNNKSLFVNSSDNELYWRSNAGTNVKLTLGSALNVAAFTGGIGGDYTAVSAAVAFDDAGDRYTFKQQSNLWARMASGDVRLFETGTTETVFVGLAAPVALAASYTATWPLALPGALQVLTLSASGLMSTSDLAATAPTFGAGATAAVNTHFTVSGTGDYKHGDRVLVLAGAAAAAVAGVSFTTNPGEVTSTASVNIVVPIPFTEGDRIKSITVARFGDGAVDLQFDVFKVTTGGVSTSIGGPTSVTNAANSWNDSTVVVTNTVVTAGLVIYFNMFANAANARFNNIRVTYDRP